MMDDKSHHTSMTFATTTIGQQSGKLDPWLSAVLMIRVGQEGARYA